MPAYHVKRSIIIDAPLQTVKTSLQDFKQWHKWSPWLIMEPDATLIYSHRQGQVGANYAWSGLLIGAGSMELLEVNPSNLKMQITFVKPFKSTADVSFYFEEEEAGTKVSWQMEGYLPFFMFWMKSKMQTFIGMDYKRGLLMLKEYIERGEVASYVHIEGIFPLYVEKYVGIPRTSSIESLGEIMKKDFKSLYNFIKEHEISAKGAPFSIYNTFDIFKKESSYISCIPVNKDIKIDNTWIKGKIDKVKTLKTMHKGGYKHLGNAWTTAMNFARMKRVKFSKKPVGYEFYLNDPYDTPEDKLITEIYLPLR